MVTGHSVTPKLPPEWLSSASGADGHGPEFSFPTRIENEALAYMMKNDRNVSFVMRNMVVPSQVHRAHAIKHIE